MRRVASIIATVAVLMPVVAPGPAASGRADSRDELNLGATMTLVPQTPRRLDRALLPVPIATVSNAIRIHLKVLATGSKPWSVIVENLAGAVVATVRPDQFVGGEYWTDEIADGGARIRQDGDAEANVIVDAYAVESQLAQPQGIFGGADESRPITDPTVPLAAKKVGPSVARIQFMTDVGGANCTGFLVGVSLLMTNHHCINSETTRASARVQFGIDSETATGTTFTLSKIEVADRHLDYSIVRLSSSGSAFGRLFLGGGPANPMQLYLIQHPSGKVKKVAFPSHCAVGAIRLAGVEGRPNDFGHICDTLGGSSGSPIIDTVSGNVIGLHHWNLVEGVVGSQNQGVQMPLIVADLKRRAANNEVPKAVVDEVTRSRP